MLSVIPVGLQHKLLTHDRHQHLHRIGSAVLYTNVSNSAINGKRSPYAAVKQILPGTFSTKFDGTKPRLPFISSPS